MPRRIAVTRLDPASGSTSQSANPVGRHHPGAKKSRRSREREARCRISSSDRATGPTPGGQAAASLASISPPAPSGYPWRLFRLLPTGYAALGRNVTKRPPSWRSERQRRATVSRTVVQGSDHLPGESARAVDAVSAQVRAMDFQGLEASVADDLIDERGGTADVGRVEVDLRRDAPRSVVRPPQVR